MFYEVETAVFFALRVDADRSRPPARSCSKSAEVDKARLLRRSSGGVMVIARTKFLTRSRVLNAWSAYHSFEAQRKFDRNDFSGLARPRLPFFRKSGLLERRSSRR